MIFDNPIGVRIAYFIDLVLVMMFSRGKPVKR
jgi:hypothetical protein